MVSSGSRPSFVRSSRSRSSFEPSVAAVSQRVYVSCGQFESLIHHNRELVPLFKAAGMQVRFTETRDGHNWENWRDRLQEGLSFLFPGSEPRAEARATAGVSSWDAVTRKIGLSLGADICWPLCFEGILEDLDLSIPHAGKDHRLEVERLTIEPFDLRQDCRFDVVLDRLTHWYHTSREWIKKAVLMDDLYVFNNPWSLQSMEKHSSYCAMMRLGLPVPETWMVPPKEYEQSADLEPTLSRYAEMFDLGKVGERLGFPMFMKPYDGGAWVGVSKIESEGQLRTAYEQSGRRIMHLQRAVDPHDLVRSLSGSRPTGQHHSVRSGGFFA